MHNTRRFGIALLLALLVSGDAAAQDAKASVQGHIISRQTLLPVEGAKVLLRRVLPGGEESTGTSFDTTFLASSDKAGRFRFEKLRAGRYVIEASHLLDSLPRTVLDLARSERVEVELTVGRELLPEVGATVLPELRVDANLPVRSMSARDEFENRRRSGGGQYITREIIQQRNPSSLTELFRMVSGVEVRCRRGGECLPRMVRAKTGCWPSLFVDGMSTDLRAVGAIGPRDVYGMEVYLGLSEAPLELTGNARCGTIMIWTRLNSDERRNKQPAGSAKP
jgi:hypothetical protein